MTILLAIILYLVGFYLLAKRTVPESAAPGNRMMIRVVLFLYTPALRAGLQWQPICRVTSEWCCIRSACSLLWWRSETSS